MEQSIMPGSGRFLTLADVADILNISAHDAHQLVISGELPAIKIGGRGHWRVERELLESYIEGQYEQARRMSLWEQANIASVIDFPSHQRSAN
jgi:excisionase family DNA binding protein